MSAAFDDATLDTFADGGLALLGIAPDPAWRDAIRANLRVSMTLAALVTSFPIPDEAEPAPVFVA